MNDIEFVERYLNRRAVTWSCHHYVMLRDPANPPFRCPLCGCGHPMQAIVYEETAEDAAPSSPPEGTPGTGPG